MSSTKRWYVTAMVVALFLRTWAASPAQAHGGDDEGDPVNLVEQALAILVNTPAAVGEALERVEEALVEEAEAPSGELDLVALEEARSALEEGRLHDAEDALVAALGQDPHEEESGTTGAEDQLLEHGLTTRIEGGLVALGSSDVVTLIVALLLLGGGLAVLRGRGGAR